MNDYEGKIYYDNLLSLVENLKFEKAIDESMSTDQVEDAVFAYNKRADDFMHRLAQYGPDNPWIRWEVKTAIGKYNNKKSARK